MDILKHGVTMDTSLTTFDGFPRADIDVAQSKLHLSFHPLNINNIHS